MSEAHFSEPAVLKEEEAENPFGSSDDSELYSGLNRNIKLWKSHGNFEKFRDYNIFYYKQEGSENQPFLVLLHGYPSSCYDWSKYIGLEKTRSILTFDLLGFGLSDKPVNFDYPLAWQADLVEEMIRRHTPNSNTPVFIIAHDLSTSVAAEIFARDIEGKLSSINLVGAFMFNGNMIIPRARFSLGQKILRSPMGSFFSKFTNFYFYRQQLSSVFSSQHPLTPEEADDQWILQSFNNGHRILHKLLSYTFERTTYADRWLGAVRDWKKPIYFAWGLEDPISTVNQYEGWKELRPHAETCDMPGLGHFGQIEDPKLFKEVVDAALEKFAKQNL